MNLNNGLIWDYQTGNPEAQVRNWIFAGRGGSGFGQAWNGNGITSTTAHTRNLTNPEARSVGYGVSAMILPIPTTSFLGQTVDSTAVVARYTITGDLNLDGSVDDDDVTVFGATYAPGVSKPFWA
jgi:hypothetical protein